MEIFNIDKILGILGENPEALTYGEVFAKYKDYNHYSTSLLINLLFPKFNISKVGLFFGYVEKSELDIPKLYRKYFLPTIYDSVKKGIIQHEITIKEKIKRRQTHTNFVSDKKEKIDKRLENEMERKTRIQPTLMSVAEDVVDEISRVYPKRFASAYLFGSGCYKNDRPFIYYGNEDVIRSVSDLDIMVFGHGLIRLSKLKKELDKISRSRKVLLDPYFRVFRGSKKDKGILEKGVLIQ